LIFIQFKKFPAKVKANFLLFTFKSLPLREGVLSHLRVELLSNSLTGRCKSTTFR
jgi:hypothetical protein